MKIARIDRHIARTGVCNREAFENRIESEENRLPSIYGGLDIYGGLEPLRLPYY